MPMTRTLHALSLLLGLMWTLTSLAQGPRTSEAIQLAQAGRTEEAAVLIDDAIAGLEGKDPMTWYVKAFIQKTLYVERDARSPRSAARDLAVGAILRCVELDANGRLGERRAPLLSFLADTHLEDARDAIRTSQPDDARAARGPFEQYVLLQSSLDTEWDPIPDAVLLDQQLAEFALARAAQEESAKAGPWFEWGTACYQAAAARPHDRFRSWYNLAVHTYNQGVREFKSAEEDLDALDGALRQAARHWRRAAEDLERAIDLDPERKAGYEALAVVSEALLNQDRIDWCKAHLSEMGGR